MHPICQRLCLHFFQFPVRLCNAVFRITQLRHPVPAFVHLRGKKSVVKLRSILLLLPGRSVLLRLLQRLPVLRPFPVKHIPQRFHGLHFQKPLVPLVDHAFRLGNARLQVLHPDFLIRRPLLHVLKLLHLGPPFHQQPFHLRDLLGLLLVILHIPQFFRGLGRALKGFGKQLPVAGASVHQGNAALGASLFLLIRRVSLQLRPFSGTAGLHRSSFAPVKSVVHVFKGVVHRVGRNLPGLRPRQFVLVSHVSRVRAILNAVHVGVSLGHRPVQNQFRPLPKRSFRNLPFQVAVFKHLGHLPEHVRHLLPGVSAVLHFRQQGRGVPLLARERSFLVHEPLARRAGRHVALQHACHPCKPYPAGRVVVHKGVYPPVAHVLPGALVDVRFHQPGHFVKHAHKPLGVAVLVAELVTNVVGLLHIFTQRILDRTVGRCYAFFRRRTDG